MRIINIHAPAALLLGQNFIASLHGTAVKLTTEIRSLVLCSYFRSDFPSTTLVAQRLRGTSRNELGRGSSSRENIFSSAECPPGYFRYSAPLLRTSGSVLCPSPNSSNNPTTTMAQANETSRMKTGLIPGLLDHHDKQVALIMGFWRTATPFCFFAAAVNLTAAADTPSPNTPIPKPA